MKHTHANLPWSGNFQNFCQGLDQINAPCNLVLLPHTIYLINEVCECAFVTPTTETKMDNLSIYPNPTYGQLFWERTIKYHIKIFNLFGQVVFQEISNGNQINISHLKSGYYLLELMDTEKSERLTLKLIKVD